MTEFVAVTGNGSWGGPNKTHAADPATAEVRERNGINYTYYRSLCGQPYMQPASKVGALVRDADAAPFADAVQFGACKRCVKLAGIDS